MRARRGSFVLAAALWVVGCGSSPGGMCADAIGYPTTPDCKSCLGANCSGPVVRCYGPDWATSHLAGVCAAYTACLCGCKVLDSACFVRCAPDATTDCLTCQDSLASCVSQACQAPCSSTMTYDGGAPDGGADL